MAIQNNTWCKQLVLIVFVAFLYGCSDSKAEKLEESNTISGEKLYTQNCLSCHGLDGTLGVSGATDLSKTQLSISEQMEIIKNGKGLMPPFAYILKSKESEKALIHHLNNLKK